MLTALDIPIDVELIVHCNDHELHSHSGKASDRRRTSSMKIPLAQLLPLRRMKLRSVVGV